MGWRSELDIVNSEPKNFSRGRSYRDAYLPSSPSCRVSSNRLLDCLQQFVPGASPHNNCDRPSCDHNSETESGLENMEHSNACLRGYAGTRETCRCMDGHHRHLRRHRPSNCVLPQFPTPERVRCALWDVATKLLRFLSTSSSFFLGCRVRAYHIINLTPHLICLLATRDVDDCSKQRDPDLIYV